MDRRQGDVEQVWADTTSKLTTNWAGKPKNRGRDDPLGLKWELALLKKAKPIARHETFCHFAHRPLDGILLPVVAQDTLTVVQYNLLNYGNYTSYCCRQ